MGIDRWRCCVGLILALPGLCCAKAAQAGEPEAGAKEPKGKEVKALKGLTMDYGPFLSYSVKSTPSPGKIDPTLPPAQPSPAAKLPVIAASKGIVIKVGTPEQPMTVCFDCDLMRMAAGWSGGFLGLPKTNIGSYKGTDPAILQGSPLLSNAVAPGWSSSGDFSDPRAKPMGPLPPEIARYKGLYLHGGKVVLSYSVGACEILEMPGAAGGEETSVAFTRTFQVGASDKPLTLAVCDLAGEFSLADGDGNIKLIDTSHLARGTRVLVAVDDFPLGAKLKQEKSSVRLVLPPHVAPRTFKVVYGVIRMALEGSGPVPSGRDTRPKDLSLAVEDLSALCKGGPPRWGQPIVTAGIPSKDETGAYVADAIPVPDSTPYDAWMRLSGMDFFTDGRAALCTLNGDVWIVSGLDEKLEKVSWRRFATGLYEPLGLRIVDEKVYVLGRDQITRLHDLNGDGEADFYENFCNAYPTHTSYHAFSFDLQSDAAGNFYFVRGANQVELDFPLHSALFKVSKDGGKMEVVATGFRAPNGMSVGPQGQITCGDNQGHWMPASKINLIQPGGFYGHVYDPRKGKKPAPASFLPPLCWLPHAIDTSSGGQVWVAGDKWGPFKGHLLHTSYGRAALFHVMQDGAGVQAQGGVSRFPINFASGIMRGRFNPKDGQLYVCGLKGWQTDGARDGGFYRVRYTGKPARMPAELRVRKEGIEIKFTDPLDAASAGSEEGYGIEQWNYKWSETYGSKDYSVASPEKPGRDAVAIKSVKLLDSRTVLLEIPDLKPVMQMRIQCRIKCADGAPLNCEIYNSINKVP